MSCLLESRHEKSVQLISAARQYNQSVIMRHLLWSNTVLFDSGLVKNLEYSLLLPIFSVLHLSVCLSARVSVRNRPFVHLSVCLLVCSSSSIGAGLAFLTSLPVQDGGPHDTKMAAPTKSRWRPL